MHENKRVNVMYLNSMLKIRKDRCAATNGSPDIFAAVTYRVQLIPVFRGGGEFPPHKF